MAGIFILKLISWNEKPAKRAKDYSDLKFLLKNYFNLYGSRFYEENLDCLDDIPTTDFEFIAGARLLGRDMSPILALSEKLKELIFAIIDSRLSGTVGDLNQVSSEKNEKYEELDRQLVEQLKKGVVEMLP